MDSNFTDLKYKTMDNELLEKVEDLLRVSTENVSANHWIPAIHEDKHESLAKELVKLLSIHIVSGMFSSEKLENAFDDGVEAEKQRCGYFDIENYR